MKKQDILLILQHFPLSGNVAGVSGFGSGLINDTYQVLLEGSSSPDYVLQRINHHIFKQVEALMDNTLTVTAHLNKKLKEVNQEQREQGEQGRQGFKQVLKIMPTNTGKPIFRDDDGNYWRMTEFISGAKSYDMVQTPKQAHSAGWAFGKFHQLLADLDPEKIAEVIPNFHHIGKRLEQFEAAVLADKSGRVAGLKEEIEWIRKRSREMLQILEMGEAGKLPVRILHYDTKFNNVLLDDQDQILCIIDLDTVMPGYLAYDFGDAIRTIINTAPEDEADLDKIKLNLALFEAYTQGYFAGSGTLMTSSEIASLIPGVLLLPYMQAVRFLTDYVDGDLYYKIKHDHHNLQRTRAQMRLVEELEIKRPVLEGIIETCTKKEKTNS